MNKTNNYIYGVSKTCQKNPTKLFDVNKTPLQDWSAWQVPPRASKAMRGTIKKNSACRTN